MGLEKVNFFYFEPKFKTKFFSGGEGGGGRGWLEQVNFFTENPIFFWGVGVGTGWRTGGVVGYGQTNRPKPSSVTLAFNLGKKMF